MSPDPYQKKRVSYIQTLHQSPAQIVAAFSGGGTLVLSDLLTIPGASRTIIEATVPYSFDSISSYLGRVPEQFCSSRTARNLAMTAFYHARRVLRSEILRKQGHVDMRRISPTAVDVSHDIEDITESVILRASQFVEPVDLGELDTYQHVIGIGCTASLVTDRQKMGEHRVHVAVQTLQQTVQFSLQLRRDARTRWEEERLVADLILNAVETVRQTTGQQAGHSSSALLDSSPHHYPLYEQIPLQLQADEVVHGKRAAGTPLLVDLFFGKLSAVLWTNHEIQHSVARSDIAALTSSFNPHAEFSQAIFPGAFSPIHQGHLEMIHIAEERLQDKVVLEMSIQNVDKPPLDYIELEHRLECINKAKPNQPVWLTQTPLFVHKAELFQGTTFVVGADTLKRFADLRFYHENTHALHDILRQIAFYNCRFLVFARQSKTRLESLETLEIPDMLRSLCDDVPPSVFTMDISSSDLRRQEPP